MKYLILGFLFFCLINIPAFAGPQFSFGLNVPIAPVPVVPAPAPVYPYPPVPAYPYYYSPYYYGPGVYPGFSFGYGWGGHGPHRAPYRRHR